MYLPDNLQNRHAVTAMVSAGSNNKSMKHLIVGLGNIGPEYDQTRHNIGFMIADALADSLKLEFKTDRYGDVAQGRLKNQQVVILKPSTYMNLSGNAVRYWKDKENVDIKDILVLVDDLALPFGAIRIKPSGSDAGHNGLKNIADKLSTQAYPRLRFGIGNDFPRGCQVDYVLSRFSPAERDNMAARIDIAVDAIKTAVLAGLQTAMCDFNNK